MCLGPAGVPLLCLANLWALPPPLLARKRVSRLVDLATSARSTPQDSSAPAARRLHTQVSRRE